MTGGSEGNSEHTTEGDRNSAASSRSSEGEDKIECIRSISIEKPGALGDGRAGAASPALFVYWANLRSQLKSNTYSSLLGIQTKQRLYRTPCTHQSPCNGRLKSPRLNLLALFATSFTASNM